MVVSMLLALTSCPAMLGTQEAIRQSQAKERREEHRARRCNLIVGCVKTSIKGREINGKKIVLRDSKLYIDIGNTFETDESAGHPFAGYYLPYPDSEHEGLVSTITHVAPILNWIYIDKDTYELKYGVRDDAQPHLTGPFDCTRQDRRLTFEDWEGFVAVEEHPAVWALYFDRDDNGLKGKLQRGVKILEVVLTRQERKKGKDEAKQQVLISDKEKNEEAGEHKVISLRRETAQDAEGGASREETAHAHAISAADLAKLKIGTTGPSSVSSDHVEGTVSSPTEPWGTGSMWSNQEQHTASTASHLAPFTPSSSIYGDEDTTVAIGAETERPEESTPKRTAYRKPYVEDESSAYDEHIAATIESDDQPTTKAPLDTEQAPVEPEKTTIASGRNDQPAVDAAAGAESGTHHTDVDMTDVNEHHSKATQEPDIDTEMISEAEKPTGAPKPTEAGKYTEAEKSIGTEKSVEEKLSEVESNEKQPRVKDNVNAKPLQAAQANLPTIDPPIGMVEAKQGVPPSISLLPSPAWPKTPIPGQKDSPQSYFQISHVDTSAVESNQDPSESEPLPKEVPERPATPSPQPEQQAAALNKTPEPDYSELRSTVENLPAWAALPEPYWGSEPNTPRRPKAPIEEHSALENAEMRNLSRPQAQEAEEADAEETAVDQALREQSAPPITMSREPYPLEDDPTSADTSVADVSFISPTPYSRDETDTTADKASLTERSTHSSTNPGEAASEGNRGPESNASGKEGADGSMQNNTTTAKPKLGWRSLTTRLKVSKDSVLKRSRKS